MGFISFDILTDKCLCACLLSCVLPLVTPWTVAYRAPLSMEFSRQEYWSGLPFPAPGHLPDPENKPSASFTGNWIFLPLSHLCKYFCCLFTKGNSLSNINDQQISLIIFILLDWASLVALVVKTCLSRQEI